ncbi:max dimerization protein 1-like isoform X1 [Pieris napi]|uniref:max dimerization protein 1-like isoform X1 n=1 Tax=Pieris brassicae TaxID=7116 RepID=UPI001E65FCA8|nr:max dimerization protein 1-like isoform X1 [Pieris brassicae]XP_047509541.1 max dimerization protein 1-like isoform X1 [Pieris napi]
MSIADLIQAAEYIERRDRVFFVAESEHGYASSLPAYEELRSGGRRPKTKKSQGSRTTHNELEKNRRAHLRSCLEKLKDMVPLGPEASRHTTLGLLTKAKRFIKSLEEREKRHSSHKEQLSREQRYLRRRLAQLRTSRDVTRSISESSMAHTTRADSFSSLESSSGVSTAERSPSSVSESDEVDVIGYTSNQSDSESLVSGHSGDSGVGVGVGGRRRRCTKPARSRYTRV